MKKYVVILIDEMKIKEGLVYDKHSAHIIGFVNIGDVGNQLSQLEERCRIMNTVQHPQIATHMPVLMVRATKHLTATSLSSIMWQGIERLEFLGFQVLVDGASTNRKCIPVLIVYPTRLRIPTLQVVDFYTIFQTPHIL